MIKNTVIALFFVFVFVSCEINYEFPEEKVFSEIDLGQINSKKVIAFGDDYLAGVMDGALFTSGQTNSAAAIIASQLNKISETGFQQPNVDSETGFNFYMPYLNEIPGKWIYRFQNLQDEKPVRTLTKGELPGNYKGEKNDLNNLAFPNFTVKQSVNNSYFSNPYFTRISTGNKSIAEQITEKSPTFLICWFGINDYLEYAMEGAVEENKLTTLEEFELGFNSFLQKILNETESKIIAGNLISICDLPYFYLNQYNFIRLSNAEKSLAQAIYKPYNESVAIYNVGKPAELVRPMISFEDNGATLYPQPLVVIDDLLPDAFYSNGEPLPKFRQLKPGELALYNITPEMVKAGWGWKIPLDQTYYLNAEEIDRIEERKNGFNQIINQLADKYPNRLAVADLHSVTKKIAETGKMDAWGISVSEEIIYQNGLPLEGGLELNSIFSLDAVHFNQRGNAFIAAEFIKSINATFGATVPLPEINSFAGNVYTY